MSAETPSQEVISFEFIDYLDSEEAVFGYLSEGLTKDIVSSLPKFAEEIDLPYEALVRITGDYFSAEMRLTALVTKVIAELDIDEPPGDAMIREVIQSLN